MKRAAKGVSRHFPQHLSAFSAFPKALAQSIAEKRSEAIFEAMKTGLESRGITSATEEVQHTRWNSLAKIKNRWNLDQKFQRF